eukprot:576276-Prymnesium_polylepis.1
MTASTVKLRLLLGLPGRITKRPPRQSQPEVTSWFACSSDIVWIACAALDGWRWSYPATEHVLALGHLANLSAAGFAETTCPRTPFKTTEAFFLSSEASSESCSDKSAATRPNPTDATGGRRSPKQAAPDGQITQVMFPFPSDSVEFGLSPVTDGTAK